MSQSECGKHYADHLAVTATYSINPNDRVSPVKDPNALYAGGAFLTNHEPDAGSNRRGIQMFAQAGATFSQLTPTENTITLGAILLQPKSRGHATIQDNDPLKAALGDQGDLTDEADLKTFMYTYKVYIKRIADKLAAIASHYKLLVPTMVVINDDKKLTQFIKDNMGHGFHPQSMNRMDPNSDKGVVDVRGHVHGVENLVIADDTIIPYTVDGNTSSPALLIGAMISEQILREDHVLK